MPLHRPARATCPRWRHTRRLVHMLRCVWVCRAADVTADGELQCYTLERQVFMDLLGPIQDVWRLEALRKVPMLYNLRERQLVELAQRMTAESFTAGQLVFRQGDTGRCTVTHPAAFACATLQGACPRRQQLCLRSGLATLSPNCSNR